MSNTMISHQNTFTSDERYTGSQLDRPGLDALRDAVQQGAIDIVAVLSPDRLARKYAHQVLLLEELRKAGCEVVFLHRPITDDPQDQLLLQIQGAVAEYKRAVIGERFRHGKLQKARKGHWLGGKALYGYSAPPGRSFATVLRLSGSPTRHLDHRHDAGPHRLGQPAPRLDNSGQVGRDRGRALPMRCQPVYLIPQRQAGFDFQEEPRGT
jgi:hypothetical protein